MLETSRIGSRERATLTAKLLAAAQPRATLSGEALVVRSDVRRDRYGHPYAVLVLRGTDGGLIEARWWKLPIGADCPAQGTVYWFEGTPDRFNGTGQLCVTAAHPIPEANLSDFVKSTKRLEAELVADLETLVASLDGDLARVVWAVLSGETYTRFCAWPASHVHHGAVRHGLLEHSLRVAVLAEQIATCYGTSFVHYDRSLAIAAGLLHDIGKVHTLPGIAGGVPPDAVSRFDHVTLGALMVQTAAANLDTPLESARLDALLHAILAHHGRKEWGAPIEPQTVEAWLVHLADLADARLWHYSDDAAA